jgi:DNA-binding MarR family transcriptional regulator
MRDDTPRLTLDHYLPYRLSILSNTVSGAIAKIYDERFGLKITEWRIMAVLGMAQPLTQTELCNHTRMDKVQVSRAVSKLMDLGNVRRVVDEGDRRRVQLSLSPKGEKVYAEVAPLTLEWEKRLLENLSTADAEALESLITKLQTVADTIATEA